MQYGKVTPEVIAQLKEMVGEKNVLAEGLENYARDETPNAPSHPPDVVVKPEDTASVSRILKLANEKLIPVTPRGGGTGLSGRFGANAAWWGITVLAFNLNSLMKRLVLPQGWAPKRMKAIRFGFINLAGRVMSRARQLIIRLSGGHPAYELLKEVRQRLRSFWAATGSVSLAPGPL